MTRRRTLSAVLLGCSAMVLLCGPEAKAQDTLTLPQINVTAPSPIVRRRPPAPPATTRITVTPAAPAQPAVTPTQGTLPIVVDQFATVTVVPREEIQRSPGSTLGDVLFAKPGITGSSFAPGAASRPIIRGLDVNRVGVVDNGIGGGGVSDLGEDHFVPVNPLATDQIEVIRGPATLRYGSQSIGGVVSSTNNRIPDALPCGRPPPDTDKALPVRYDQRGCTTVEGRGAVSSADNGRAGGVLFDSGAGNFAFHADAFGRRTDNYRVPSYPYLVVPDATELPFGMQPQGFNGRQPNSWTHSSEASVGGSYLFLGGFAGVAYTRHNNLYAIPGADGEGHGTRIDARQDKLAGKGEYRPSASEVDAIRYWWGYTDYKHNELGWADAADRNTDGIRQTFTNKDLEGRVEVQLMPFNLRFAELTTAIGVQGGHQRLAAPSPDEPGSPLNGLFDPNRNSRVAGYIFNEFKFSNTTKAQLAGRIEQVRLAGMMPAAIPDTFADPGEIGPAIARNLTFTPKSASAGLIQHLPWDMVGSATAQYVERSPKPAELFSRGAHDATATFDIGNPNLKTEVAKSVEVGLRRAKGPFRFEAIAYYTKFDGFIFRRLTGNTCDGATCIDPAAGTLELRQAIYSQRDATFRGGEFQFQWDTLPMWQGFWGVDGQYEIVRATFTDGTSVPRIPPQRIGGGIYFRNAEWFGRVSLLHAFAQNDIAIVGETPTGGYNLLKVEVSYTRELKNDPAGIKKVTVGVVGSNLLNDDVRSHVSYTKDQVLMPGASARLFASVKY
jgi:iron complex outermembrane receptor protein